jgi:ABC-type glycerol-3-phosphate transport system substrate-binding protein
VRRRTLLRAAAGAAVGGTAACGRGDGAVQVVVVWSGAELDRFREVLDEYARQRGHAVDVFSAGDDIDELLRTRAAAGSLPDVAVLPRLGLIRDFIHRGLVAPLDQKVFGPRFPAAWNELLTVHGELYGAWVKGAHKSLIWTRPSTFTPRGVVPKTFEELVDLVEELADRRPPAPLAVGAADGWVLTDWFENVLASVASADEYQKLAEAGADWESTVVADTLRHLGRLWSVPGLFPDGGSRALLTQWEESVVQVVRTDRAAMVFEGDFVYGVVQRFQRAGDEQVLSYRFPPVAGGTTPLVVSGDAAVVLRTKRANPRAHDLVEWLTSRDVWPAFRPWLREGYVTPNLTVPDNAYDRTRLRLVQQFRGATRVQFDLSDQMRRPLSGGDGSGSWKILQDFFAEVTGSTPDIDAAVRHAVGRFRDAS